jgi:hypothetical protein
MLRDIVTAFIIGASLPAFILFFTGFYALRDSYNPENCLTHITGVDTYYAYTLIAPMYIGVMSAIAVYLSKTYNLTTHQAFTIIALISATIVSVAITYCEMYNWTPERLNYQYFKLFFYHAVLYIVIIATIYNYIECD